MIHKRCFAKSWRSLCGTTQFLSVNLEMWILKKKKSWKKSSQAIFFRIYCIYYLIKLTALCANTFGAYFVLHFKLNSTLGKRTISGRLNCCVWRGNNFNKLIKINFNKKIHYNIIANYCNNIAKKKKSSSVCMICDMICNTLQCETLCARL